MRHYLRQFAQLILGGANPRASTGLLTCSVTLASALWVSVSVPNLPLMRGLDDRTGTSVAISLQSALLGIDDRSGHVSNAQELARALGLSADVAKLLSPELSLDDLFRTLEALRDLGLRNRPHRLVPEAVDVLHLERVEQHPVEAGEVAETALEGLGMGLGPVPRQRAWKVNGLELPRTGARGLEAKLCRCLCVGQWKSFPSDLGARWAPGTG